MMRRWWATVRDLLVDVRARSRGHDLMLVAAGLTLYAGIAIVPLLLLGLYGAGVVIGADRVAMLVERLAVYAPPTMGAPAIVRELGEIGPRLGIPSLIASLVTASTYGEGLLRAVDSLEGEQRGNRTVAGRVRVVPYLGVFPLVTMAGLLTVAGLPGLLGGGATGQVLGVYLTFWIGWLSATVLLLVLYPAVRRAGAAVGGHRMGLADHRLVPGGHVAGLGAGAALGRCRRSGVRRVGAARTHRAVRHLPAAGASGRTAGLPAGAGDRPAPRRPR